VEVLLETKAPAKAKSAVKPQAKARKTVQSRRR
jgi:hypothetical protein